MRTESVRSPILAPALVLMLVAGTQPAGGTARPAQGGRITAIPVRVVADDGQPVVDLGPGEVSVKVDGRAREVRSMDLVDLRATAAGPATPASTIPPPFATNSTARSVGRTLLILVDEQSIDRGTEPSVRDAARHLIQGLGPRDRVAVMSLRQGGPSTKLSAERSDAIEALARLDGYRSGRESKSDLLCRTALLLRNVQAIFASSAAGPSATIVLFSAGIAALDLDQIARFATDQLSDNCEIRPETLRRVGVAAQASQATFYVAEIMTGASAHSEDMTGGLENLAGVTGGEFTRVGVNIEGQMRRILQETSAYYLVSFEDESSGPRRIEVAVSRPRLRVRAPKELGAGAPAARPTSLNPRDIIRSADAFGDVPLRAAGYVSRNPGDKKIRLLALFEPIEDSRRLKAAMIGVFDKSGTLVAQWTAQANELGSSPVVAALVVPPGGYRMRVAATEAGGRTGAVDVELTANLVTAGPIQLGDLVLGRMTGNTPVPAMEFTSEPEAIAMIELYGRPAGPLTAYLELTRPGGGEPLEAVPLTPSATSEPDKFILSAKVPIASLKPGDYVARAVVGVQGQEGRVIRTLRKAGSAP